MFKHIDNDEEILDFLTDVDVRFTEFDADRITSFYVGTNYNLLLFFSKEGDKGFHLFTIENFKYNLPDFNALKEYLVNLFRLTNLYMIKEAISQVDVHIVAIQAAQLFEIQKRT
ncbi:MAG: hypothetical protein JST81_13320 [Bacteroidetes bacterium]|nr:hypothetical protein [Bacteroidota bacterium]